MTTPPDDFSTANEPIFDLGGPLMRDRRLVLRRVWSAVDRSCPDRDVHAEQPDGDGHQQNKPINAGGELQRQRPGEAGACAPGSRGRGERDKGPLGASRDRAWRGESTSKSRALPVGRAPRQLERLVFRRRRLGRGQPDVCQRDGDVVSRPAGTTSARSATSPAHVPERRYLKILFISGSPGQLP